MKFAPLLTVPNATPPEGTSNQEMLLPAELAFNCEGFPGQTEDGVAVTLVGVAQGCAIAYEPVSSIAANQDAKSCVVLFFIGSNFN